MLRGFLGVVAGVLVSMIAIAGLLLWTTFGGT